MRQSFRNTLTQQNNFNTKYAANSKRIWVRKNNNSATTINISPYDIVDDLKYMIANKFPTTLGRQYDPADLNIKLIIPSDHRNAFNPSPSAGQTQFSMNVPNKRSLLQQHDTASNSPNATLTNQSSRFMQSSASADGLKTSTPLSTDSLPVNKHLTPNPELTDPYQQFKPNSKILTLEPDLSVWLIVEKYFPHGMSMSDAFIVDTDEIPADESMPHKYDLPSNNKQFHSLERQEMNLSSYDMNHPNQYNNNASYKTAIIGDQKVPPPRLRLSNTQEFLYGQVPQSSAVILFPKDIRNGGATSNLANGDTPTNTSITANTTASCTRSNTASNTATPTPSSTIVVPNSAMETTSYPPSPKVAKESSKLPTIHLSSSPKRRTNSSELNKSLNLKVNTTRPLDTTISEDQNKIFESAVPTPETTIKEVSPEPNSSLEPIKKEERNLSSTMLSATSTTAATITPSSATTPSTISKPTEKKDTTSKEKKLGISKILSHINVLVVEDNLVNQKIMARHLKSCKVQFQIASTGKEALEMWKKGGFHLCFMDIQLPVMSGIEVTKEIRRLERLNHIGNFTNHNLDNDDSDGYKDANDILDLSLFRSPIIIVALTASTGATDQQNALAAGCNDYLTKPVQLKWLKNKLTEWGYMQALINYDYFRSDN